jgi:Antp family protein
LDQFFKEEIEKLDWNMSSYQFVNSLASCYAQQRAAATSGVGGGTPQSAGVGGDGVGGGGLQVNPQDFYNVQNYSWNNAASSVYNPFGQMAGLAGGGGQNGGGGLDQVGNFGVQQMSAGQQNKFPTAGQQMTANISPRSDLMSGGNKFDGGSSTTTVVGNSSQQPAAPVTPVLTASPQDLSNSSSQPMTPGGLDTSPASSASLGGGGGGGGQSANSPGNAGGGSAPGGASGSGGSGNNAGSSGSSSGNNNASGSGSGAGNSKSSGNGNQPHIYPWMKRVHIGTSESPTKHS